MPYRLIYFCILLVISPVDILYAQQYPIKKYSVKEGLIQSEAVDIIQDRDGFIWVATFGGASRFDGIHFRNYTSSKGLAVNKVNAVFQDSKGQIWFGTLGGGLCYLDNNRFRYISEKDGLPNNNVNAITEDQDGNMWFGTDGGISRFDGSSLENFGSDSGGQLTHVTDILITRSGAVYAATTVSGCYKFNGKSFVRIKDAFSIAYNLFEDDAGRIWVSAQQGYSVIENDSVRNSNLLDVFGITRIDHIMQDSEKNFWFASYGAGACRYNGSDYKVFNTGNGLSSNLIYSCMEDNEGNIWFATYGGGICRLGHEPFVTYHVSDQLGGDVVISISEGPDGDKWFGMLGGGIKRLHGSVLSERLDLTTVKGASVWKMVWDDLGNQWIASNGGLDKISPHGRVHFSTSEGLNDVVLYDLMNSDRGLWISTESGVNVLKGNKMQGIAPNRNIKNTHARPLFKDKNGDVWVGMYGGGIYKIEKGTYKRVFQQKGMENAFVSGIVQDFNGNLWFSTTGNGLVTFNPHRDDIDAIMVFNERNGLITEDIMSLALDSAHHLWMGTTKGVEMLDLEAYYETGRADFNYYGMEHGFSGLECIRGAIFVDKRNHVWFGTVGGVVEYNPQLDIKVLLAPNIYISDVTLMADKSLNKQAANVPLADLPSHIELPYDEGFISIAFSAISYTLPEQTKYHYTLQRSGSKQWSDITIENKLTFSGLPFGDYTFSVKARSSAGVFSKQPAVFKFSVLPPFWKTWWFLFVAILMITSAIYFLIRLRTIRLHRNKQVLEELVSERTKELSEEKSKKDILLKEIHHRVKNNLQVINSLISLQSNYIEDEKALALFVECKDRIKSMALIHEKMYESTDLSNINLRDYVTALANDLISTYGTNKFISLDLDISVDTLDVDTISPLGLLLSEILSNSLKHAFIGTDRGKIFIQFEQTEGSKYKLVIGDNGIGMSGDKMPEQSISLGMELIKSFVEQLDGTIERVRRPGTVYRIVFETGEKA